MNSLWIPMVPSAAVALFPRAILRTSNAEPFFEDARARRTIRVAARGTFPLFAAILSQNPKA